MLRIHCVILSQPLVGSWCYGGDSGRETPGDIPNPVAKLPSADGTALGRVWESRTPPDFLLVEGRLRQATLDLYTDSRVRVTDGAADHGP